MKCTELSEADRMRRLAVCIRLVISRLDAPEDRDQVIGMLGKYQRQIAGFIEAAPSRRMRMPESCAAIDEPVTPIIPPGMWERVAAELVAEAACTEAITVRATEVEDPVADYDGDDETLAVDAGRLCITFRGDDCYFRASYYFDLMTDLAKRPGLAVEAKKHTVTRLRQKLREYAVLESVAKAIEAKGEGRYALNSDVIGRVRLI